MDFCIFYLFLTEFFFTVIFIKIIKPSTNFIIVYTAIQGIIDATTEQLKEIESKQHLEKSKVNLSTQINIHILLIVFMHFLRIAKITWIIKKIN